jgi:hypothetical protein
VFVTFRFCYHDLPDIPYTHLNPAGVLDERISMKPYFPYLCVIAVCLTNSMTAFAGSIVYDLQNYSSLQNGYALSGTVSTDGAIGNLAASNIVAWTITLTPSTGPVTNFNSTMSGASITLLGSVVADANTITLGASAPRFLNQLTFDSGSFINLTYAQGTGIPNIYSAQLDNVNVAWNAHPGAAGLGGDPWIIAVAESPTAAQTPEPVGLTLLCLGASGMAAYNWRRRKPFIAA